jgi:glycosidase
MTMPGAPMIYYGDEAGMWGGDDPDCRKPMVWQEIEYENEISHPFNKTRPSDEVSFNQNLFDWYRKLISIRNENKTLQLGDINFILIDDENDIICYQRSLADEKVFIILNNKKTDGEINLDLGLLLSNDGALIELIEGKEFRTSGKKIGLPLQPYQVLILKIM